MAGISIGEYTCEGRVRLCHVITQHSGDTVLNVNVVDEKLLAKTARQNSGARLRFRAPV